MAGAQRRPGVAPLRGAVLVTGKMGGGVRHELTAALGGTAGFQHREDGRAGDALCAHAFPIAPVSWTVSWKPNAWTTERKVESLGSLVAERLL